MLVVRVNVDVAESLRRGFASDREMIVRLTEEQLLAVPFEHRQLIVDRIRTNVDGYCQLYGTGGGGPIVVPTGNLEGIVEAVVADKEQFQLRRSEQYLSERAF